MNLGFESFVNSEECKTVIKLVITAGEFESFVNSEECKTIVGSQAGTTLFESFVNSEECKTISLKDVSSWRLRALLIQKSVKPFLPDPYR